MGGSNIVYGRIWFLGCALPVGPEWQHCETGMSMGDSCCIKRGHQLFVAFLLSLVHVNEQ